MRQSDETLKRPGTSQRSKPGVTRERFGSSDRAVEGSSSSGVIFRPPVILMKPPRRDEDEEEWPSINKSTTVVRSQQQQFEPKTSSASTSLSDHTAAKIITRSDKSMPRVLQQGYQQQKFTEARTHSDNTIERRERQLNGGIKLITESMEWSDIALEHLSDNADFFVVGIIGPQGVGKSTLMSMIGGNDPFDMYRQYIFRPACKECTETSGHQTQGVQFFVNENRVILLDSQAILSPSVMNLLINNDRRYSYECSAFENYVEIESMQIASFLMQVCHALIVLVDYFVDVDILNFIRTCEMLKPSLPLTENPSGADHRPHLIVVQNRGKREDFLVNSIKEKSRIIELAFEGSTMSYSDGISMKDSSFPCYKVLKDCSANFYVLPDMKPRGYKSEAHTTYKGVPDYEVLVRKLRNQIVSLPRNPFYPQISSEKNWFHYATRMWDLTRKSFLIAELGRLLP